MRTHLRMRRLVPQRERGCNTHQKGSDGSSGPTSTKACEPATASITSAKIVASRPTIFPTLFHHLFSAFGSFD